MGPQRTHVPAFQVAGLRTRTRNQDEGHPSTAKIAPLWARFMAEQVAERVPHRGKGPLIYGVYSAYESDFTGAFDVTAGVSVDTATNDDTYCTVPLPSSDYLVFERQGPLPQTIIALWTSVWEYMADHPEHKRQYTADFEVYRGPQEVAVYIAIF